MAPEISDFSDFTVEAYRSMLVSLRDRGYTAAGLGDRPSGRHVILRHDVDISLHRARDIAGVEAQEGFQSTYFLMPRGRYYSLTEPECFDLVQQISGLGHEIGLHFDTGTEQWSAEGLGAAISREQRFLERLVGQPIGSVSYHNPDMSNALQFNDDKIAWLHNAYSAALKRDYVYSSDSNGYWRFKPMPEVIAAGHDRLYLLTHPEWWTPTPMAPRDRIARAVLGRAEASMRDYDRVLRDAGRVNVGLAKA